MSLPIYKVLSLVIRVFSKPLVTYMKQVHIKSDSKGASNLMRKAFIGLGNAYNKGEAFVNRKFMKIQTQFAYKPLNDDLAVEKGIQFFYEIIFYSLVIGLPLYEMMRNSNESKAKSKALDEKLQNIDSKLEQILAKQAEQQKKYEEQTKQLSKNTKRSISSTTSHLYTLKLNKGDNKPHKYRILFETPMVAPSLQSLAPLK